MNRTDFAIRWITAATVLGLGLVAAIVSYQHGLDVAVAHGQTGWTARLTPLTIDGVVLAGGMILLACARAKEKAPKLAYATLAIGIGATLYVNGLYGASFGRVGIAVAAWPAVAFVFATELLMGLIRRSQSRTEPSTVEPAPQPVEALLETPQEQPIQEAPIEDGFSDPISDGQWGVDPAQAMRDGILSLMVSAKRSGMSYAAIGSMVGMTPYKVTTMVKPYLTEESVEELDRLKGTGGNDLDDTAKKLRDRGAASEEIADHTGWGAATVEAISDAKSSSEQPREETSPEGRINGHDLIGVEA